jgi:RNA polymerase sigma-70 factor, ECF subfamily
MEAGVDVRTRAAELYATFGPVVYRRCLKLLHDREAARDATQDVFVKLVHHIERLAGPDDPLPWIYRVATNHCLHLLRARRRRGREVDADAGSLELAAPTAAYPSTALARAVLSRFDAGTQAVAVGVLVDGMEHTELAEALGISRKTVQRRLDRFLARARDLLGGRPP